MSAKPLALTKKQLARVIEIIARSNPAAVPIIEDACKKMAGVVRIRSGTLYGSAGFQADGAGVIQRPRVAIFAQSLGDVDAVLGELNLSHTNILTPGKVESSTAFIATHLGCTPHILDGGAGNDQALVTQIAGTLMSFLSAEVKLVGNDEQRKGTFDMFPGTMVAPAGALGTLAAGAQAAGVGFSAVGAGRLVAEDPALEIGADTTLRVIATMQPQGGAVLNALTNMKWFYRWCWYGYEITQVRG